LSAARRNERSIPGDTPRTHLSLPTTPPLPLHHHPSRHIWTILPRNDLIFKQFFLFSLTVPVVVQYLPRSIKVTPFDPSFPLLSFCGTPPSRPCPLFPVPRISILSSHPPFSLPLFSRPYRFLLTLPPPLSFDLHSPAPLSLVNFSPSRLPVVSTSSFLPLTSLSLPPPTPPDYPLPTFLFPPTLTHPPPHSLTVPTPSPIFHHPPSLHSPFSPTTVASLFVPQTVMVVAGPVPSPPPYPQRGRRPRAYLPARPRSPAHSPRKDISGGAQAPARV